MKTVEYVVTIWTNGDTSYDFIEQSKAFDKLNELKKKLKSNQRIEMTERVTETKVIT